MLLCTYGVNGVGEVDLNLDGVAAAAGNNTPFTFNFDDACIWVIGAPAQNSSTVRQLEQTIAGLSAVNPHTGNPESLLGAGLGPDLQGALVDQVGQKLLHMSSSLDPARDPTFTLFWNPNFFFLSGKSTKPTVGTGFAWNHGDTQPEIARTFIGIAGPGVKNLGVTEPDDFFTDHVDVRPTIMFLTGLTDDYQHDGRVITELIDRKALPDSLRDHSETLRDLGQVYKQINAPFGDLAKDTLKVSTFAIVSNSDGDLTYSSLENKIAAWTAERDSLTALIKPMLENAEFGGQSIDTDLASHIIRDGRALLDRAEDCAEHLNKCAE